MNFWVIFITGLTTGGLTCLAVQGGLLATAMTKQVTMPQPVSHSHKKKRIKHSAPKTTTGIQITRDPLPVLYFLIAKLIAYTIFGFLLGWLGTAFQISLTVQGIIQIAVGLFMLASALNMLNVHPIFRYAVIQPPKFLTRLVRNQAKSQEVFAPALLGFLTVFIPCGTTQGMMALAIVSGSALAGALVMFIFILGTSPTFLVLGVLASQLRGNLKKAFTLAAVILITGLSVISIDSGLNLLGVPIAPSRLIASFIQQDTGGLPTESQMVDGKQQITIRAFDTYYAPARLTAQSGKALRIKLVTRDTFGCTRSFTIPAYNIRMFLPQSGEEYIDLPELPKGQVAFSCGMGMYTGVIDVV
jgi:uncharacterized protein